MTIMGVVIKNGKIDSVKGKKIEEILLEDLCAVIIDDVKNKIYIWSGSKANVKDRFIASRLAHGLNAKIFGLAGTVEQNATKIKDELSEKVIEEDVSLELIKSIIG